MMHVQTFRAHVTFIEIHPPTRIVEKTFTWLLNEWMQIARNRFPTFFEFHCGMLAVDIPGLDFAPFYTFNESTPIIMRDLRVLIAEKLAGRDVFVRMEVRSKDKGRWGEKVKL